MAKRRRKARTDGWGNTIAKYRSMVRAKDVQVRELQESLQHSENGRQAAYQKADSDREAMREEMRRLRRVIDGDGHDSGCNRHVGRDQPDEAVPVNANSCLVCRQNKAMADARQAMADLQVIARDVSDKLEAMTLSDSRAQWLAKRIVDGAWLAQGERAAQVALREGKILTIMPPVPEQYAQAAATLQAVVNNPPTTRLALAADGEA